MLGFVPRKGKKLSNDLPELLPGAFQSGTPEEQNGTT
jgi:hypothetical protein